MQDDSWAVSGPDYYGAIGLTIDTNINKQGHVVTNDSLSEKPPVSLIHFTDSHGEEHDICADWFQGEKMKELVIEARSRYGNRALSQTALFELAYELEHNPKEADDGDWF